MTCYGCIHEEICRLWLNAEGQDASCYGIGCKDTSVDIICDYFDLNSGDGYEIDRMIELVQADRDGKCVVLPCKVGERLWCINNYGEIEETVATGFLVGKESVCIYYREKMSSEYYNAPIGKVLFLTREAAEKALKGECKK